MDDVACAAAEVTPQRPVPHIYQLLTEPQSLAMDNVIARLQHGAVQNSAVALVALDLATLLPPSYASPISFPPKSYRREVPFDIPLPENLSHHCTIQHSTLFTFSSSSLKWHARLTFSASWPASTTYNARVFAIQRLVRRIRLEHIPLLRDTVTEIVVSSQHDADALLPLPLRHLATEADAKQPDDIALDGSWYYVREDTSRVRFPSYSIHSVGDTATRTASLSALNKESTLAPGVSVVRLAGDKRGELYVYKEIERPLYRPDDTTMIERELQRLMVLRDSNMDMNAGIEHIVRLVAAVVSDNPYRTSADAGDAGEQTVLRGILLEYHRNGNLEGALSAVPTVGVTKAQTLQARRPWRRWAVQIARGLQYLHAHRLAHVDLKPANVVISGTGEAIIIDISGWAGTHEYLAPEVRDVFNLSQLGFGVLVKNDCWALGKVFDRLASAAGMDGQVADGGVLQAAASGLMVHDLEKRMGISEVVSWLEGAERKAMGE
ncbi:hypothetical protein NKR19_g5829 [Coniochaeta hoffmannii]|uniref:Protein kinase domain-containing protein n=1 Tax=Coniochaeta hoffmannii TaxID=91930 RepID=A0AA38RID4_9PEZI|nr:hypothetical protein NKR19_g5829 [Coniochaeta hoffmannii]